MKRTVFALLLAAATVTLTWFLFMAALGWPLTLPDDTNVAQSFGKWFALYLFGSLLLGLPAHWLLTRLALRQWWSYVLASFVIVGGGMWALSGYPNPLFNWPFFVGFWLPCVLCAALGALAFWFVGVRLAPFPSPCPEP